MMTTHPPLRYDEDYTWLPTLVSEFGRKNIARYSTHQGHCLAKHTAVHGIILPSCCFRSVCKCISVVKCLCVIVLSVYDAN